MQPELGAALPFTPGTISFCGRLKGRKIGLGGVQIACRHGSLGSPDLRPTLTRKSRVLHQALNDFIAAAFGETLERSQSVIVLLVIVLDRELRFQLLQRRHMRERIILDAAGMLRPIRFGSCKAKMTPCLRAMTPSCVWRSSLSVDSASTLTRRILSFNSDSHRSGEMASNSGS